MHWRDVATQVGRWCGLALDVAPRPTSWHVEGKSGHLRVSRAGRPLLWARIHPQSDGAWWWRADDPDTSPVLPITTADMARVDEPPGSDAWFAQWARFFASALDASDCSPLYGGEWQLSRLDDAQSPGGPFRRDDFLQVQDVRDYLTQPASGFEPWGLDGSCSLLGLHAPADASSGRLKAWRKRAGDGTLPPVLLFFLTPLDMWVVLDGHERLNAALREGKEAPLLGLWNVRRTPRTPHLAFRRGVEQRYALQGAPDSPSLAPLSVDTLNALALQAWDDRPFLTPTLRGRPLVGGLAQWREEVSRQRGGQGAAAAVPDGWDSDTPERDA